MTDTPKDRHSEKDPVAKQWIDLMTGGPGTQRPAKVTLADMLDQNFTEHRKVNLHR